VSESRSTTVGNFKIENVSHFDFSFLGYARGQKTVLVLPWQRITDNNQKLFAPANPNQTSSKT